MVVSFLLATIWKLEFRLCNLFLWFSMYCCQFLAFWMLLFMWINILSHMIYRSSLLRPKCFWGIRFNGCRYTCPNDTHFSSITAWTTRETCCILWWNVLRFGGSVSFVHISCTRINFYCVACYAFVLLCRFYFCFMYSSQTFKNTGFADTCLLCGTLPIHCAIKFDYEGKDDHSLETETTRRVEIALPMFFSRWMSFPSFRYNKMWSHIWVWNSSNGPPNISM